MKDLPEIISSVRKERASLCASVGLREVNESRLEEHWWKNDRRVREESKLIISVRYTQLQLHNTAIERK